MHETQLQAMQSEHAPSKVTIEEIAQKTVEFVKPIIENNWSFFLGMLVAIIATKFFKTGIEIAVTILLLAVGVSLLTNCGLLPPLDELMALAKKVLEWIFHAIRSATT